VKRSSERKMQIKKFRHKEVNMKTAGSAEQRVEEQPESIYLWDGSLHLFS
jgi:hypothetical protein